MDDCIWSHCCRGKGTVRGACLARRLISGAGRISLATYADPELAELETLAHVWSPSIGAMIIGCTFPREWTRSDEDIEVRIQIDKTAVLPDVRILAGAAHALGRLRWLSGDELAAVDPEELGALGAVVGAPSVRLAVVRTPRVLLHAAGRVEPHDVAELMSAAVFPSEADELAAHEAVLAYGEPMLARLVDAVAQGWWPGEFIRVADDRPHCGRLVDRVFLVDVSVDGLVLLVTAREGAWLATADFLEPVDGIRALHRVVGQMLAPPIWSPGKRG